jgi:hypothetical protein
VDALEGYLDWAQASPTNNVKFGGIDIRMGAIKNAALLQVKRFITLP